MTVEQLHPADDSWTAKPIDLIPDTPPLQPQLANTGLLYPGKRHVFSGPPESAKTLAAYCVLIQTARTGGTGILIDFEMGPTDTKARLRELGATIDELSRLMYVGPTEPANPARIQALIRIEPVLVVIDAALGAYQLEGLDDNKRSDVETINSLYITAFWVNGIATLLIDHVTKNTENRGRFVIGSERKLGSSDVHLGFETIQPVNRGSTGKYKITTHKDRGGALKRGHLADLHLESDPETHQITWRITDPTNATDKDGHFRPTGKMQAISMLLQAAHEPLSQNAICTEIGGDRNAVLAGIKALIREGFATQTAGKGNAKPVTHARPYRENDPACNPENPDSSMAVCEWFGSSMEYQQESSGMAVCPPIRGNTTQPLSTDHPKHTGWYDDDGRLTDTYLESIAPDPDDQELPW
jgi:biotin operon repressor